MTNIEIGSRIKQRREQLGLTQQFVADTISLTKSTIQRYETGQVEKLKMPVIMEIARAIDANPDWIIGKADSPQKKEPALAEEDRLSPLDKEILTGFRQLPPAVQELVRKQIAAWKASE